MQCPACRTENRPGRRFCSACGATLPVPCPRCGFPNLPGDTFCGGCGVRVQSAAAAPGPRAGLEDERKHVTVLFADTKASMELLVARDPEEARHLLDPVLERMMEAVHHYGGTVNQVMGDGIMALFGAPLAHEDHAVRACYAALRIQDSVRKYAAEMPADTGAGIRVRVGLHSGEVVVRSIGSDVNMDYTAVGHTTHLAARMEQIAPPGGVLLTADTVRLAEAYIAVAPLGPTTVKGVADPVETFQLLEARAVRSRFADRELTRLIGRDQELEQLRKVSRLAVEGHGQVVALVGEPGVGKSRLVWEFARSPEVEVCLQLETSLVSYGTATAYLPVINLLRSYFSIEPRDEPAKIRDKVVGKVLSLGDELGSVLPALLSLLDVEVDDRQWRTLDPRERRRHTLDALKRLLVRQSQIQPLLIVMENLQWIDFETQAFLDSLVGSLPTARILLLVTYRPEHEYGLGKTYYTQLRLDPLPPDGTGRLLRALLGDDASLGPLERHLGLRTGGNPFFIEESIRTLVETGTLVGERGAYSLRRDPMTIEVPPTVQAVLAARIDRLPAVEKRILQSAAVIGTQFSFGLLQAVVDTPEPELRAGLKHLQAAEFIYEARLFPDVEYTFTHALTHDVAYRGLLQARRRDLHARIVEAIEQLPTGPLAEHVESLAYHAYRAERWEKAVTYLRQAGARAAARSATREAVAALEQALDALGRLPESRETIEHAIDLRFELQSALIPVDQLKRMLGYLGEAERLAEAIVDQRRLARVWAHMTYCFAWLGDPDRAIQCGQRALAVASATGDQPLELLTHFHLGRALFGVGEHRRAIDSLSRTAAGLARDDLYERFGMPAFPAVTCHALKALCLAQLGEFGAAGRAADEGHRAAVAANHPFSLGIALWGRGLVHLLQGNVADAVSWLERAVELCRLNNFTNLVVLAGAPLGHAYALSGRLADGLALLEETTLHPESVNAASRSANLVRLAEVYLLAGAPADALRTIEHALQLARVHGQQAGEANGLRVLGDVYADPLSPDSSLEDRSRAEAAYREALERADRLEMRPLVAHCHRGLGTLYRRTGRSPEARDRLAAAVGLFRELDMRSWMERAQADLET